FISSSFEYARLDGWNDARNSLILQNFIRSKVQGKLLSSIEASTSNGTQLVSSWNTPTEAIEGLKKILFDTFSESVNLQKFLRSKMEKGATIDDFINQIELKARTLPQDKGLPIQAWKRGVLFAGVSESYLIEADAHFSN
ncbi:MAG: hypothetical protein ACKO96_17505, partial [Flammeovirgaceae bacterium]